MTAAIADLQKYRLLMALLLGMLAWEGETWAQSPTVTGETSETAVLEQNDRAAVDQGKLRLQLLVTLVENELGAAIESKTRLTTERSALKRERKDLQGLPPPLRSVDKARLARTEQRLLVLNDELAAVDALMPDVTKELDELQRRLDAANGIVRPVEPAAGTDGAAEPAPNPSPWPDRQRQIQEALVYLSDYNALIDGDVGPRTRQAVRVYQKRNDFELTGILTEEQEQALLQEASVLRVFYGVKPFGDEAAGYRLAYPSSLLSEMNHAGPGRWRMTTVDGKGELLIDISNGSTDLTSIYDHLVSKYEIQYWRKRDAWFVVAGFLDPQRIIYDTVRLTDDGLIRARLIYPKSWRSLWSRFAVIMFNSFEAVPRGES